MRRYAFLCSLFFVLAVACDDEPDAPAAAVTDPAPDPEPEPAVDRPEVSPDGRPVLAIDTARSSVGFVGRKISGAEEGHFNEWSGSVRLGETIEDSSVEITIQMASVETNIERLTGHLRSGDFFDAETHPTARFSSSAITAAPDTENATHRVTGRLTLRGQSRAITFPARIELSDEEVHAEAEFTIDRQDFGIRYPGMPDDLISDDVTINFDVHAPRTGS